MNTPKGEDFSQCNLMTCGPDGGNTLESVR